MPHRVDTDGEGATDANQKASLSGSGIRRLDNVIPFPRGRSAPASTAPDVPPTSGATHFTSLGEAAQSVVLKLSDGSTRLKVRRARPAWEELK